MGHLFGTIFSLFVLLLSTTMGIHDTRGAEEKGAHGPATLVPSSPIKDRAIALFNGKDLTGWKAVGKAAWEVKEGVLIGRQGPSGESGDLLTGCLLQRF